MKLRMLLLVGMTAVLFVLAGCQASADETAPETLLPSAPAVDAAQPDADPDGQTQVDEQGAVAVGVTPLNLSHHDQTLDFEIAMNTHSVDLSMDLAELAVLATDDGQQVAAVSWAPSMGGGHHVSGLLQFPANPDGRHLLEDAHSLTLSIQNVDAPNREFTWQLTQ